MNKIKEDEAQLAVSYANQIDKLSLFILNEFPDEIGKGDFKKGEGAVEVAIRLLKDLKHSKEVIRQAVSGMV